MHYNSVMPNDLTDEELVRRVQARDEAAFAELVARYSPRIWSSVVENSRQRRDAEEILMDIWMVVWENINGLRKVESFGAWLRRITFTACSRYYSTGTHGREIVLDYEDLAFQVDKDAEQRFHKERLRAEAREAVHHLPQRVRSVGILYYLELWSVKEVAAELDLAIGTVKTKLSEIRRLLRKEFGVEERKIMSHEQEKSESLRSKFKVIGVGGAGCNVVKSMMEAGASGIEFCVVDTDKAALSACEGAAQVQIGVNTTLGSSTDGILELGRRAAAENMEALRAVVADAKMVFITAGMGGGTGTSVAPLIASLSRAQGTLTVCFVTYPFEAEEERCAEQAALGLQQLQTASRYRADAVIVVRNQQVIEMTDRELSMREACQKSDEILLHGIQSISDIIVESEGNCDFSDIQEVLRDQGNVLMGIGKAKGENRAKIAAENAVASPLLGNANLVGDKVMIVNITAPPAFTMRELDEVMKIITETAADAQPIFGLACKDELQQSDEVAVTIIANGSDSPKEIVSPSTHTAHDASPGQADIILPSTSSEFVHLHNHSEYSLLDGACRIPDMVQWAIENSSPAIAITDHGNMFGAWEFYNAAKEAGVNPIVGCEVYVEAGNAKTDRNGQSGPYHLTLLAEDATGYANLLELTSLGYTQGLHRKPCITLEILREYHDGIIALTGCIYGIVPQLICSHRKDEALRNFLTLKDIMGENNLYVEIQNHYLDTELAAYPVMLELAKEHGLPIVGTNDCHYLRKSDHRMHDVLCCIQTKKTVNTSERLRFDNHFYFKNVDEMQAALKTYPPEAISNTVEIANRCNLQLDYDKSVMPIFEVPAGHTHDSYLKTLCYDGLRQKYGGHLSEPIRTRLECELDIIQRTGHANYFLVVADCATYANKQGYLFSARGSAAGSLVLYALSIIDFNPMDYGCLFERFLNLDRLAAPDINIDFPGHARQDMFDYLVRKYGQNSVGRIVTFATLGARSAIKDVGRALEMPLDSIEKLTDLIPTISGITLDAILKEVPEFQTLAALPENRELIEISQAVEGMKRHVSCHNSAVVISNGPLTDYAPLFKDKHGHVDVQFQGKTVEDVGVVRLDILGLRSLSEISGCLNMIRENRGRRIALEDIPLDDKETYSLISAGLIAGLFQLETSPGMQQVVTELKAENFEEFSAILALYRPGPLENGDLYQFIARKNGIAPTVYAHPSLENVLKSTFGVCIYQEQVMQIACEIAGFTFGEADVLRSAMGKRNETLIAGQRQKFVDGAIKNGIAEAAAEELFEYLKSVGRYVFNKAHTVAYSLLSYRMAYLKTHYPHEFMAAMLSGEAAYTKKINRYRAECPELADFLGVEINLLPLDINCSEKHFTVEGNDIRCGFLAVAALGDEAIDSIIAERHSDGLFTSLQNFRDRVNAEHVNAYATESLVASGAFKAFSM